MSSVVISGDTSGSITLAAPAVSGTNTATLPAATGTVMVSGNMPAFNVYVSGTFTGANNTYTKVPFNTKTFDTNTCFDTTNYRFTPNVAGYYQVQGSVYINPVNATSGFILSVYKNGTEFQQIHREQFAYYFNQSAKGGTVVYCNGSTDYIELYMWQNGGTTHTFGNSSALSTWFSGGMIRGA